MPVFCHEALIDMALPSHSFNSKELPQKTLEQNKQITAYRQKQSEQLFVPLLLYNEHLS